jgi:hypothetical protein
LVVEPLGLVVEPSGSLGVLQRRERPHLLLSDVGVPTHLYNGVCLANGLDQNASGANHCFTLVQRINPA